MAAVIVDNVRFMLDICWCSDYLLSIGRAEYLRRIFMNLVTLMTHSSFILVATDARVLQLKGSQIDGSKTPELCNS